MRDASIDLAVLSDDLLALVAAGAPLDRTVAGCTFTEGPVWHAGDQRLFFSDMPQDKRRRRSEAKAPQAAPLRETPAAASAPTDLKHNPFAVVERKVQP